MKMNICGSVKERNEAFVEAVVNDNWNKLRKYSKKYGVPIPKNKVAMKAGVYKAVQYCTDIPEKIKLQAIQKCLEMGFNPYVEEYGIPDLRKGEAE
jgi:uncharacterized alkaline shock family protein YloU